MREQGDPEKGKPNKSLRMTLRRRATVVGGDEDAPFWLEHIGALVVIGLVVIVGGIVVLAQTDWGRLTMVWLGLGIGLVVMVVLAIVPWSSLRAREPAVVWIGGVLSAIGWGGAAALFFAGAPYALWRGFDNLSELEQVLPGVGAVVLTGIAILGMLLQTRASLPALDRVPRTATVLTNEDDSEGGQILTVRYLGVDDCEHDAELADRILDSWRDRFVPGSTWQVYAFRDPELANIVVFLTEEHDNVWRQGYKLDGVRLGGESGPLKPGPGSPFLREGSKWKFEE